MIDLTYKFNDKVPFKGMEIPLNLAFDNVLQAYKIIADEAIEDIEKIRQSISLLSICRQSDFTIYEQGELLSSILDYLNSENKAKNNVSGEETGVKALDFNIDAGLIYSAFLQDYGIDLYEQQGKLHWFKFLMLLDNITNRTKLSEVIGYRVVKIPPENKYNRDEVRRLRKLKKIYALEQSTEVASKQIDDTIRSLFSMFGE